jgi:hypothetical protein
MRIITILAIFISTIALAGDDQMFLDGGVGVFNSGKKSLSETKFVSIGNQEDLWGPFKDRVSLGGWLDNAGGGRSSSALVAGQLGFEVNSNGLVGSLFSGPALISTPDVLLGGHFQFQDNINLGIQDKSGNYIGVEYKHLSSAGLEMPNIGRDSIGLELRMPW